MEELNKIGEQPADQIMSNVAEASENLSAGKSEEQGSPLGKFKDAKSLLGAYNELEKEFTKKCQRLSELEKHEADNVVENTAPVYMQNDWQNEIQSFLESHKEAQSFAKDIAKELMENKDLANSPNALDLAYAKVLSKNYKSADELLGDETFVNEKILNNEKIRSQIINDYLKGVVQNSTPPLILDNKGSSLGFSIEQTPKSLEEARKMVEKMFK